MKIHKFYVSAIIFVIATSHFLKVNVLNGDILTWDTVAGDGTTITEGSGNWSPGVGNWNHGGIDRTWVDGNDVVFGGGSNGSPGIVSVTSLVEVGSMTFNPPSGLGSYSVDLTNNLVMNGNLTANTDATFNGLNTLYLNNSSTWSVASGKSLSVSSIRSLASTHSITKTGAGALTLSGSSSFEGGLNLDEGTLNISSPFALALTPLQINGGVLDNSNGQLVTLLAAPPITLNADLTFLGSSSLNIGTGAVSLGTTTGTSRTITTNASTLTLGGAIENGTTANSIVKAGSGGLILNGTNTFTGDLTMNAGTLTLAGSNAFNGILSLNSGVLRIEHASALGGGSSTFVINGGTIDNASSAAVSIVGSKPVVLNSNLSFTGTRDLNLGSGSLSLGTAAGSFRKISVGRAATLTVGGVISNGLTANSVMKDGSGTLALGSNNTYSGETIVREGVLRLNNIGAVPGGVGATGGMSALKIEGGVVGLGIDDFSRSIGTGIHQVELSRNAGFAAYSADRVVNFGGASSTAVWGSESFLQSGGYLILGASNSDRTVTLQNPIDLGGAARTVLVNDGSAVTDGAIAGGISGNNGSSLVKRGNGILALNGSNTYAGETVVNGGVLLLNSAAAIPGGIGAAGGASSLRISNGVIGLGHGDFNRDLGTGASQVRFEGNGGFAAFNANRIVNFGGASSEVTWDTGNFIPSESSLILSDASANARVTLQNPINLNGSVRTIQIQNGSAAIDGTLSGVIGGTGSSGLRLVGAGTLSLTAANTYSGTTDVNSGVLLLNGAGTIGSTSRINLNGPNARLALSNTAGANNLSDRLPNVPITTSGGFISFANTAAASTNYSETIGSTFTMNRGALNIVTGQAATGQTSILTLGSIARNAGATVLFSGDNFGIAGDRNAVKVTTALSGQNVGGILPYALIEDLTLAAPIQLAVGGAAGSAITRVASYTTGAESTWTATANARPTSSQTLTVNRSLNALVLDDGINLDISTFDRTLTLGSATQAGLVVQSGGSSTIGSGSAAAGTIDNVLAFGTREAIFNTVGNLTIERGNNSVLTGTGGLTKTGMGTLQLGGVNPFRSTMSGALNINQGLVDVRSDNVASLNSFNSINLNGGDLTISDTFARNYTALRNQTLTVNADARITANSLSPQIGNIYTFGNTTISNTPVLTIAGTTNGATTSTPGITLGAVTLNSPVAFNIVNSTINGGTANSRLAVGAITDNGNSVTIKGNGLFAQNGPWTGTGGLVLDSSYLGTAVLSQLNTFTGGISVNGGTLAVNAAQNNTSGVTLNGGTINVNSDNALGTSSATFSINGGTINTAVASQILTANQPIVINNDFNFTGTGSLNLGNGPTSLGTAAGTDRAISARANTLTLGGIISDGTFANGIVKLENGTLELAGANSFTGPLTVNGGTLRASNNSSLGTTHSGVTVNSAGTLDLANNVTITDESLVLVGSGRFSSSSGANTWNGPVSVSNSEFSVAFGSDAVIKGAIGGVGGLEKTGSGVLRLDNDNIYTGQTIVKAGTLVAARNAPSEGNGSFGGSSGGIVQVGDTTGSSNATLLAKSGVTIGRTINVQAGSTGQKIIGSDSTSGVVTFGGAITLGDHGMFTSTSGGSVNFDGSVSGDGMSVTKIGNGLANLTASNTFSGFLIVSEGTLAVTGSNGIVTPSAIVLNSSTGSGTTLASVNTASDNLPNRLGGSSVPITVNSTAGNLSTLSFLNDHSSSTFRQNLGALTIGGTAGDVVINADQAVGGISQLTFSSLSIGNGISVIFNGDGLGEVFNPQNEISFITAPVLSGGIIPGATINSLTDTNANASVVFNAAANNGLGAYSVVVSNVYNNDFTHTYPVAQNPNTASGNATTWVSGVNANPYGPVKLATQSQINSLKLTDGSGIVDLTGNSFYLESGTLKANDNNQTIQGGTLIAGKEGVASSPLNLSVSVGTNLDTTPTVLSIASVIADNGNDNVVSLAKTGVGSLVLGGNNTYSGSTEVTNGVLKLGASNVMPDGAGKGNVILTTPGTMDLNGYDETINGLSGGGIVDITGGGSSTLTLGNNNTSASFSGVIQNTSGTISLNKIGTGTQVLSGTINNTFVGTTSVSEGVLELRNSGALVTSSGVSVASNATLQLRNSVSLQSIPLSMSGSGVSDTGALRSVSGTNSYAGAITLNADARINSDAGSLALNGTIDNHGFNLTLGGSAPISTSAIISGSGGVTKDGSSTLDLGGLNTYSGSTTISQGILKLSSADTIPDGDGKGSVFLGLGSTFDLNGKNETINGLNGSGNVNTTTAGSPTLTVGNGNASGVFSGTLNDAVGALSFTKIGTGTQVLSSSNIHQITGNVTVQEGVLRVNSFLGGSGVTLRLSGGELQQAGDASRISSQSVLVDESSILSIDSLTPTYGGFSYSFGTLGIGTNTLTVNPGPTSSSGANSVTFAGTTLFGNATFNILNRDESTTMRVNLGTLQNGTSGIVGVTKAGTGTLVFSGANGYTGRTNVSNGTLLINGNQAAATGLVTVGVDATLGGNGTIGGVTSIQGTHSPGTSPGIQRFTNGLTYESNAKFFWELQSNTNAIAVRGTSFDGVDVTGGVLTINSNVNVNLIFNGVDSRVDWFDPFWSSEKSWLVFQNAISPNLSSNGGFSSGEFGFAFTGALTSLDSRNVALADARPGFGFVWEQIGNNVVLTFTAIPEPSNLGGVAILLLTWLGRQRTIRKHYVPNRSFFIRA